MMGAYRTPHILQPFDTHLTLIFYPGWTRRGYQVPPIVPILLKGAAYREEPLSGQLRSSPMVGIHRA